MTDENILFVESFQVIMLQSCSSQSTDPDVEATRLRTLEDDETIPSSSHSTIPNGDFVVSTENDIPIDISDAAQLPTTNGLDKRAPKKRRIVNAGDDEEKHTSPGDSDSPTTVIQGNENQSLPYTLKWINGVKTFECNVCTKTFNQLAHQLIHQRTHTGERPFKCESCKKRFIHLHHLKDHLRIHTGERPFSCQVCHRSFTQNSDLKRHLRIHTGEKPYECDICQKQFSTRYYVKLHKRLHNNERPYKCGGCQKKYINASELRSHWKTSNCEPSSIEECSPTNSNGSDVEGNYLLVKQFQ